METHHQLKKMIMNWSAPSVKNQLIMAPTGAGKTYLGLRICNEAMQKGKRAVFLCDRTTLINQTSESADGYGLNNHGVIQANHQRRTGNQNSDNQSGAFMVMSSAAPSFAGH